MHVRNAGGTVASLIDRLTCEATQKKTGPVVNFKGIMTSVTRSAHCNNGLSPT